MNMINLEAQMSGRSISRPSNDVLESLNRFYEAKLTGAVNPHEFPEILIRVGDLCANKAKQGKMSTDDIESVQDLVGSFTGKNADNYFSIKHEGLPEAAATFTEGMDMALMERERVEGMAEPVRRFRM